MKDRYLTMGGIVTSILAAGCCIGPALFLAFGITGLGFLSSLEWFRPYFIAVTMALVVVAFYYSYGRGARCAEKDKCGLRTMRVKKFMFWVLVVFAVFGVSFPYVAGWLLA
ncbi:hypothetical protein MNBD_DELTA01-174 [hydrothermal vent metagenome]|uniref:Mercuric transport protein, MerT n=1 Tax=hydrothermal vent metagenome TaxID=652676 RepID=A0A3B0QTS3_9ZZZZ